MTELWNNGPVTESNLDAFDWEEGTESVSPKGKKNVRKAKRAVAGLVTAGIGLTAFGLFSGNLLPWQYQGDLPLAPATAEAKVIPTVQGKDSPAMATVTKILSEQPASIEGMNAAAAGPDAAQSLPGLRGCGDIIPIAPSVSGIRAWSGGNWMKPTGITLTMNVYPAGVGSDALSQLVAARCKWLSATMTGNRVDGTVRNGNETTSFISLRNGDVITTITSTNRALPTQFINDISSKMEQSLTPACANPKEQGDTSTRNPYYNIQEFTGLISQAKVQAVQPIPAKKNQPEAQHLPDVDLPEQPDFPFYPKSLPNPVPKPTPPSVPQYPATEETIFFRVPDDTGPGCGWNFTGLVKPAYDQSKIDAKKTTMTKDSQDRMKSNFTAYNQQVVEWEKAWTSYKADEKSYLEYVGKVYEVDVKWSDQRKAQKKYKDDMDAYNNAINDYNNFNTRKKSAQQKYDADVQTCSSYQNATATPFPTMVTPAPTPSVITVTPTTDPTTTPSPTPYETTVMVTPTPYPTTVMVQPTAPISCPPSRPYILDQSAPTVPVKPTPPPDPRPEGER